MKTLEELRDFINREINFVSLDIIFKVVDLVIAENGWTDERPNSQYGICNDGTRILFFNLEMVAVVDSINK
jgi:hypothetical protein